MFICRYCRRPTNAESPCDDCGERAGVYRPPELAPYQSLGLVGEGAHGRVYKCQTRGVRPRALKVIDLRLAAAKGTTGLDDARRGFKREVKALGGLDPRRHVVELHGSGTGNPDDGADLLFLVTDLVARTLAQACPRGRPVPLARAVHIGGQLADALAYLHARKVYHRDIKPENIGLERDDTVRLFDFGLAALRDSRWGASLTGTQANMGTLSYAAPEQFLGGDVGPWTDLFALGAVLFELIDGQPARTADLPQRYTPEQLRAWLMRPIRRLESDPDRPDLLDEVIAGCLEPDARRRARQAAVVQQALFEVAGCVEIGFGRVNADFCERAEAVEALQRQREALVTEVSAHERRLAELKAELDATRQAVEAARKEHERQAASRPPPVRARPRAETRANRPAPGAPSKIDPATPFRPAMVLVPRGTFTMGSPDRVGARDEHPAHPVTVSAFRMAETQVTQAQYTKVLGGRDNPSHFTAGKGGGPTHPVEQVTWFDAVRYCNALSHKEGLSVAYDLSGDEPALVTGVDGYRLPTEAEWEYACRAGTETSWSTGDDEAGLGRVAWHSENAKRKTHPVRGKDPNPFGLCDMHGNVWEWVWDRYADHYEPGPVTDPTGPESGPWRVGRGGSWDGGAAWARSAFRGRVVPGFRGDGLGLRVARPAPARP